VGIDRYLIRCVIAGLDPAIHLSSDDSIFRRWMDARVKPGHDERRKSARSAKAALRDWQDTIAGRDLCNPTEACHIAACWSMS
jgi:hypothetical protein